MTPQERQMLNELFERLASLEQAPRDPEALAAINEGLRRAPNALYPLVQTVLVQDEALKRTDARIRELEDELGIEPAHPQGQGGFLDPMRNSLLGPREQAAGQGSVPSVRPAGAERRANVWNSTPAAGYAPSPEPGSPGSGSFLGTAAATAVGVMGGSMLMNSLRGLFGGHAGMGQGPGTGPGTGHSAFDPAGQGAAPWSQSSGGDLAKQAGLDDIGSGAGRGGGETGQRAGLFDTAQNDADPSDDDTDSDFDSDDFDDAGGDDTA